jgi:DNA-binding NarL/FixJ family response regulator
VLLVVSHPTVGAGIENLLRLERRYDVRRAARLAEAAATARAWPADAALVDALLLARGAAPAALGVPAVVLAASAAESTAASGALDDARGWVPKDASASELVEAVERLLTRRPEAVAGSLAVFAVGVLVAILATLLLYLIWVAIA